MESYVSEGSPTAPANSATQTVSSVRDPSIPRDPELPAGKQEFGSDNSYPQADSWTTEQVSRAS